MPGSILYRRLQQKKNEVLRKRRRGLDFVGSAWVPTKMDIQPGARTLIQEQVEGYGEAILQSPDASDFRLINIDAGENEFRIFMSAAGYPITWGETNAQSFAQRNGQQYVISDEKMRVTQRAIFEQVNQLISFGSTSHGVTGVLNNASVTLTDDTFDPFNANSTPEQISEWFLGEAGSMLTASNNVEYPTTAKIGTDLFVLFTTKKMTDGDETIMSHILRTQREAATANRPTISNIELSYECQSAVLEANGAQSGGTNKDRIWFYTNDDEILCKHMLSGAIQLFSEDWMGQEAGKKIYPMYTLVSQAIINYPGAMRYLDHPKKS